MKNISIGSRLLTAAGLVLGGKTVCDVGCDHGKLSLYLIQSGRAERIIATDINKMPLQKAVDLFGENGLSHKARFYLTDGLQDIGDTEDISHVVICGLGGDTMAQIIDKAPFIKHNKVKLVLLPAQSGNKIRRYLYDNGFEITGETTVSENKKFYSAICARYTGVKTEYTDFDCFVGKSRYCTDDSAKGYFEMLHTQLEKRRKGSIIDTGECPEGIADAIEQLEKLLAAFDRR